GLGPAGIEWRAQPVPGRRALRAQGRRELPRPRAVGDRLAAPQPEGPHARRRPAGGLHPADRDVGGTAAQAAGGQSQPTVLAGRGLRRRACRSTNRTPTSPAPPSSTPTTAARV